MFDLSMRLQIHEDLLQSIDICNCEGKGFGNSPFLLHREFL